MRVWSRLDGKTRTVAGTLGVLTVMGSLAAASVPLYDWFCRVTGYGGETSVASGEAVEVLEETVKVRFDANTDRGFPWEFKPEVREMEIRIGETGLAFYKASNPTDRPIAGQASYNVAPFTAGGYFTKIDCFCFEYQVLQPGETRMMPVTFYVDPEIVEDVDAKHIHTITLSYTFHETEISEEDAPEEEVTDASAALPRESGVN